MNNSIKYALVFTGGAIVGFGVCCVKLIEYALNDDDIREGIKKKISGRVNKVLYGEEGPRYSSRVSYANYYDIVFKTHEKAEKTLEHMLEIIDRYGFVTVADYKELCGVAGDYKDNKYGWTNIRDAEVTRLRAGYSIRFPRVLPID